MCVYLCVHIFDIYLLKLREDVVPDYMEEDNKKRKQDGFYIHYYEYDGCFGRSI